ncbi:hypothetical protein [Ruminococcus bicirculans (ex Wegman et al. 2014)]
MHGDHIKPWHAGGKTVPGELADAVQGL